jgi:hypothetical protein
MSSLISGYGALAANRGKKVAEERTGYPTMLFASQLLD